MSAIARLRRIRARRGAGGDAGVGSIFEAITVLLLLGIVMGVVYAGIASATNATNGADTRLQNLDEARTIMNTLSKDLRTTTLASVGGAPSFISASGTGAQLYSSLNAPPSPYNKPSIITISLVPLPSGLNELKETVTPCTWNGSACSYTASPTVRIVGTYVTNQQFLYFYSGTFDPSNPTTNCLNCGQPATVPGSQLGSITSVLIQLNVQKSTNLPMKPTQLVQLVYLPTILSNS